MSVLQSAARKGSTLTGHYSASRELSPEEVADKVAGDLEMQNTETRGRSRAISYVFNEDNSQTFSGIMSNSWFYAANKYAVAILISILKRASFYAKAVPVIILLLAVGGQAKSSTVILRLTTYEWAIFLTHIICINAVAAICEIVLFISLEIVLSTNYDAVYRCRALEGPLSYLATVAIMVNFFDYVALPDLGFAWGRVVTTIVAIIIFYAWKSFQLRKYYLSILKTRLEPKLELLAKKKRILSILASTVFLSHNHPMPRPEPPAPVVRTESFETDAAGNSGVFSNLNYVFHQIVNEAYNEGEKSSSEEEPQEVPTTGFWVSLNSKHRTLLLQGVMAVFTISGEVFIRDKASALKLGKQLYTHLSKNGHHHLTSNLICNAIRSSPFDWPNNLPNTVEGTIATALELFNCTQDSDDIILTEHDITSAVKNVYRSMKYAAGSFSDLQELNQSVLIIVDVLFWIVMFLVAQIILQLDATTVLAPVLTILFGASFAFANMLSNLLTAVAFVLFICPYDVGHRVILGFGSGQLAKGNILTVNLFYTTMITVLNEKLVIPNHVLFNERIINLAESKYATFEFPVAFCSAGPQAVPMCVIEEFFSRIKKYAFIDRKGEWKSVDVYCIGLDVPKNTLHYSIWASHVGGWAEVSRTLGARTKLWEQLQVIKRDMGIEFMELSEMRHINVEGGKGDMNIGFQGFGGASNARSSVNRQNNKDVERVSTGATSSTNSILIVDKAAV